MRNGAFARVVMLMFFSMIAAHATAQASAVREYQVKAVFLFNFTQFVAWPAGAFSGAREPLVIAILGDDPFGRDLDDTVRGEKVDSRSIVVRRYRNVEDIDVCHVLFVGKSESERIEQIVARLKNRSVLTVSDFDGSGRRGGMIRFVSENNHVRLRIDLAATKAAGLVVSSKLLRVAEIVDGAGS